MNVLLTDRELERFIRPPLWESFSTLCGSSNKGAVEQAVALYRERFATKGMFENRIYSGIADALARFQQARVQLFVVTSKVRLFAEPIVEHFGLRRFFLSVYGGELDGSYVDKSELIAKVLRSESLTMSLAQKQTGSFQSVRYVVSVRERSWCRLERSCCVRYRISSSRLCVFGRVGVS